MNLFLRRFSTAKNSVTGNSSTAKILKPQLNYSYYKENAAALERIIAARKMDVDINLINSKYQTIVEESYNLDLLRKRRNQIAALLSSPGNSTAEALHDLKVEGKNLKIAVHARESQLAKLKEEVFSLAKNVPNDMHPSVPIGDYSKCKPHTNKGTTKFAPRNHTSFPPLICDEVDYPAKDHMELIKLHDLADFERAGKVSGTSFHYLKSAGCILELGLIRYAVDICLKYGFTPVFAPDLIRLEILAACGFAPRSNDPQTYFVSHKNLQLENEGLVLTATSEFPLAGMYAGEVFNKTDLPKKMVGFGHCFRAEGASGGLNRGLYRLHQFSKVEMFALTTAEESDKMLEEFFNIQVEIFQGLDICFRGMNMSSEELGTPAYKKYDIEAWMPGREMWGEVQKLKNFHGPTTKMLFVS
ncbi:seryl-tRNA synthetase [Nowakowskiella sp. JEL0407]|nr:seryl-tRNA synthetase [Nowakowskiella sp. JEL0407]